MSLNAFLVATRGQQWTTAWRAQVRSQKARWRLLHHFARRRPSAHPTRALHLGGAAVLPQELVAVLDPDGGRGPSPGPPRVLHLGGAAVLPQELVASGAAVLPQELVAVLDLNPRQGDGQKALCGPLTSSGMSAL